MAWPKKKKVKAKLLWWDQWFLVDKSFPFLPASGVRGLRGKEAQKEARKGSPEAVEHFAVGLDPQHHVVRGGVVDEGALGVHEKHVRDPDLLHQPAVKRHAEVFGAREGQPLVLPVVPQVEGHREVLGAEGREGEPPPLNSWVMAGPPVPQAGEGTEPRRALLLVPGVCCRRRLSNPAWVRGDSARGSTEGGPEPHSIL